MKSKSTTNHESKSAASKNSTKSATSAKNGVSEIHGMSGVISAGLITSFEAIRDKLSETITEHGEDYLAEGVKKVTKSTKDLVSWGKKHPLKTAAAVAALMAVSAFLIHIMHGKGRMAVKRSAQTGAARRR